MDAHLPRTKRITVSGYPHLVIAKANQKLTLFDEPADYRNYLDKLSQLVRDKFLILYAFCLLPSQLRLVLMPSKFPLAKVMQRLHCSHSNKMNAKREEQGNIFYGRYKSIVFPFDDILPVIRSVHLWPVRTGVTRRAEHHIWNSHPIYLGATHSLPNMIDTSPVMQHFFKGHRSAERSYDRYVEAAALEKDNFGIAEVCTGLGGQSPELNDLLQKINVLPDKKKNSSLVQMAKKIQLVLNISNKQLTIPSRRQDLVMARRLLSTVAICDAHKSVSEVSAYLCRDKAQISRLVSQGIDLLEYDESFKSLYEAISGSSLNAVPSPRLRGEG